MPRVSRRPWIFRPPSPESSRCDGHRDRGGFGFARSARTRGVPAAMAMAANPAPGPASTGIREPTRPEDGLFETFVIPVLIPGRTHAIQNEVGCTGVGDALAGTGRNTNDIAFTDIRGLQVADLDTPPTRCDDISFRNSAEPMPGGCRVRPDPRPCDRCQLVSAIVRDLHDRAPFDAREFGGFSAPLYLRFHGIRRRRR